MGDKVRFESFVFQFRSLANTDLELDENERAKLLRMAETYLEQSSDRTAYERRYNAIDELAAEFSGWQQAATRYYQYPGVMKFRRQLAGRLKLPEPR